MTALERAPAGRGRDLPPGTVLNGYRIERCIGDGGFGVGYLVRDMLNQVFALKEYFPEQFARRVGREIVPISDEDAPVLEELRTRFIDEALGLVRLGRVMRDDDSIVKVRTCFEENRTAYMVMEYVEGESLEDALRRSPSGLPERTLRELIIALLNGLQLVHEAGILHRDIKPSNIILRPDGRPVLIDFGSAREMRGGGLDYTRLFSALYAPAEQVLGQQQGPYSDLYAVGAIGYRAIGGLLEDGLTRLGALQEGRPDPMPPATKVGAGRYEPSLLTTLDRVLAVEAKQRLPTATAMLAALSASATTSRRRKKRSLLVVGTAAAGVALLLGAALLAPKLLERSKPAPDLGAAVTALASKSSCALLFQSVAQDGTVWLRGVAEREQAERLRRDIQALVPGQQPSKAIADLSIVEPALCPALTAVRTAMGRSTLDSSLPVTLFGSASPLRDKDNILAEVTLPNYPAYLVVDYVPRDGNIGHLYPRPADPASPLPAAHVPDPARLLQPAQLVLAGKDIQGNALLMAGAPYGTDVILAIASSTPLFPTGRAADVVESAETYLPELQAAIATARNNGSVTVGTLAVQTTP